MEEIIKYGPMITNGGLPKGALVLGGVATARRDFEELTKKMGGKTIVLTNPLLTGEKEIKSIDEMEAEIIKDLLQMLDGLRCNAIVAHSLGTRWALMVAAQTKKPINVTLIAPPLKCPRQDRQHQTTRRQDYHGTFLRSICQTMPEELLARTIESHRAEYPEGSNVLKLLKLYLPVVGNIAETRELIGNANAVITAICAADDKFNDSGKYDEIRAGFEDKLTIHEIAGASHFVHVEKPEEVARLII